MEVGGSTLQAMVKRWQAHVEVVKPGKQAMVACRRGDAVEVAVELPWRAAGLASACYGDCRGLYRAFAVGGCRGSRAVVCHDLPWHCRSFAMGTDCRGTATKKSTMITDGAVVLHRKQKNTFRAHPVYLLHRVNIQ